MDIGQYSDTAFPPLSPERIEVVRRKYGAAADCYLRYLRIGDPLADAVVRRFEQLPATTGDKLLKKALDKGIDALDSPPELVRLFRQLDHVPFWVDWERMTPGCVVILRNALATVLAFSPLQPSACVSGNHQ